MKTIFVLGAGFSVEQGYPLVRQMKDRVLDFIAEDRHPSYWGWLQPGCHEYKKGPFFECLSMIDPNQKLQFEELLIELKRRCENEKEGPFWITYDVLRTAARRLLWKIHESTDSLEAPYKAFAARIASKWPQYGFISFNWDLLIERILQDENIPWAYSMGNAVPIVKPHGSINWNKFMQEGLYAHSANWRPLGVGRKLCFDQQAPLVDADKEEIVPNLRHLVFPGDLDLPENIEDQKLLWQDAACLLDSAEEVVFIGYSFPIYDGYARSFFRDKTQGKKIVVVNPSSDGPSIFTTVLGTPIEHCRKTFGESSFAQPVQ